MNFKLNFKHILAISILLIAIVSLGVVSANENISSSNHDMDVDNQLSEVDNGESDEFLKENDSILTEEENEIDKLKQSNGISYCNDTTIMVLGNNSFEAIQHAIDISRDNDTILLFHGPYEGNGSPIIVNKSITIDGLFCTLDAKYLSRIFYIISDNVTLKNLKLINGLVSEPDETISLSGFNKSQDDLFNGSGAAIKWLGNNGNLKNAFFEDNCYKARTNYNGRVISWIGSNGTIQDTFFGYNEVYPLTTYVGSPYTNSSIIDKSLYGEYKFIYPNSSYYFVENLFVSDAFLNVLPVLSLGNMTMYYGSLDKCSFRLANGEYVFANEKVLVNIIGKNYSCAFNATSDSNGLVSFSLPNDLAIGKYSIQISYSCDGNNLSSNSSLDILKAPSKFEVSSYGAYYDSGKKYNVKLINTKNNKPVFGVKVNIKLYTGKKYKNYSVTTDKKGIASFKLSKNSIGKHKIIITSDKNAKATKKEAVIKINKAKTNLKLSKTGFTYKKSDYLKLTLSHKNTKKAVVNANLIVKIFNNKKWISYKLKTDKNGLIKINTKNLSKGAHKLTVSSNSKYYSIGKSTSIKVK